MRWVKWLGALLIGGGAYFGAAEQALAASLTFSLSSPNTAVSPYPGPYAEVTLTLTDSTHATVTVTADQVGTNYFMMGACFGLNTADGVTVSDVVTGADPSFNVAQYSQQKSDKEVSGFGKFTTLLDFAKSGYPDSFTSLSFKIEKNSGGWPDVDSILAANSDGYVAATHVFVSPTITQTSALATGFAGNGAITSPGPLPGPLPVPLPGSGLAGGALLGVMGLMRLRRSIAER